jgi:hypothetical protein
MIDVFVDSFLYEPVNIITTDYYVVDGPFLYMHEPPNKNLHVYIQSFADSDFTSVAKFTNDLPLCKGNVSGEHYFMCAEGHNYCSKCNETICIECTMTDVENPEPKNLCYQCFLPVVSLGECCNDQMEEDMTVEEIREALRDMGIDTSTTDDINDLYNMYDEAKDQLVYDEMMINGQVKFPSQSSDYIRTLETNKVSSFEFKNGGQFIIDETLSNQQIYKMIKIISSLVDIFSETEETEEYQKSTYRLVPAMIVRFSQLARVHSGFRLVRLCLCHAVDPQTVGILNTSGHVSLHNHKPCLLVHHRIRASMRQITYDISVAFDDEEIIACTCGCKSGGEGQQKIVCVHILPVIYEITLLLFDGLADNIVCEISHAWKNISSNNATINEEERKKIKSNLITIITASQLNVPDDSDHLSIEELLDNFNVGTERRKLAPQPPPNMSVLAPLRQLDVRSVNKRAHDRINRIIIITIVMKRKTVSMKKMLMKQ